MDVFLNFGIVLRLLIGKPLASFSRISHGLPLLGFDEEKALLTLTLFVKKVIQKNLQSQPVEKS